LFALGIACQLVLNPGKQLLPFHIVVGVELGTSP